MEKNPSKPKWHAMTADAVLKQLKSDSDSGLNDNEVQKRLDEFGKNEIPRQKQRSVLGRLLMQFHNILIYVLIVAAVITALMDHWIDTWVILAVVIINAVIGFVQEGKAEKALESIREMLSLDAIVLRSGNKKEIDAEELVPGDIVFLKSGDKVPADMRLIKSKDLRVEEAPLTGESVAVEKMTDPADEDAIPGDQKSMVFSGTVITYGKAIGVVVATGAETEIGKINKMIAGVEKITTPLLEQIEKFGKWLSVIILAASSAFFAYGYFVQNYPLTEIFLAVIGLIVAAIPEGLPAIMTITLAIGVQKMANRNAIIRRLPSVETLGAVDVICSDKTGTLTRNEMTATKIITSEKAYTVEGSGYKPEGQIMHDDKPVEVQDDVVLSRLLQAARVCNNAQLKKNDNNQWELLGMPTEGALLTLSYKAGFKDFKPKRIDSIPFESDHKYMATLNQLEDKRIIFLTGAPERVLEMCDKQYNADGGESLNTEFWEKKIEDIAEKGHRTIGIAFSETDSRLEELDKNNMETQKVFLGLIGISDPPREEAVKAIEDCKNAGVEVKMITGDHVVTAKAIGKSIGICDNDKAISGNELEKMSDNELEDICQTYNIYARTTPEHKLRLVTALQNKNHLCAMTGDGVNDAPALKKANIGIAMGIKGTEVTKDASEMVLADDNFASIANAIEEGRTVYDNIRKALLFILPTNGAESLVLMAAILIGITMPITPAQILWVNMVTAVTLALALAFEPMETDVMKKPPRKRDAPILGKMFMWRITFVSLLIGGLTIAVFSYFYNYGLSVEKARTLAVNTLVAGQLFYLFNCRNIRTPALNKNFFNNKLAFLAAAVLIIMQLGFVYLPFMNTFFNTAPISTSYWLYAIAGGALVFALVEIEKFIFNRIENRK